MTDDRWKLHVAVGVLLRMTHCIALHHVTRPSSFVVCLAYRRDAVVWTGQIRVKINRPRCGRGRRGIPREGGGVPCDTLVV